MQFTRVFATASAWTFTIPAISSLLARYVGDGTGWADPFSGENSPAEHTNDHNSERPTKYHMDAADFANFIPGPLLGVLYDPPYSYRQIKEHYQGMGIRPTSLDTSANFYYRVIDALAPKVAAGGYAISFGWNSNGFGESKGFDIVEILLVAHGLHHNDTIVTVERKVQSEMF